MRTQAIFLKTITPKIEDVKEETNSTVALGHDSVLQMESQPVLLDQVVLDTKYSIS
jgi:hypothetical protein